MDNSTEIPWKTSKRTTIQPNNHITGHIPWENHNWKKHMYPNVHYSTIARTWKQPRFPLRWMDTETVVHYTMEYYSAIKKNAFESVLMSCQQRSIWSRFFQWSCMNVRVRLWRKLSAEKLILLNYGLGEDSWESLGLQGDPTSPS